MKETTNEGKEQEQKNEMKVGQKNQGEIKEGIKGGKKEIKKRESTKNKRK